MQQRHLIAVQWTNIKLVRTGLGCLKQGLGFEFYGWKKRDWVGGHHKRWPARFRSGD